MGRHDTNRTVDITALLLYTQGKLDENEMLAIDALLVGDGQLRRTVQLIRHIAKNPDVYLNPLGGIVHKVNEIDLLLEIARKGAEKKISSDVLNALFRRAMKGTMCVVRAAIDITDRCVVAAGSLLDDGSRIELPCAIGDPENSLQKASRLLGDGQNEGAFKVLRNDDRVQSLSIIHVYADGKARGTVDIEANGLFVNIRIWDTTYAGCAALIWKQKTLLSFFEYFKGNDFVVAHFDIQAFSTEIDFSTSSFSIVW